MANSILQHLSRQFRVSKNVTKRNNTFLIIFTRQMQCCNFPLYQSTWNQGTLILDLVQHDFSEKMKKISASNIGSNICNYLFVTIIGLKPQLNVNNL